MSDADLPEGSGDGDIERVFVMAHVPKTGGTSILDGMTQIFGTDRVSVQSDPASRAFLVGFRKQVDNGIRFFTGHITVAECVAIRERNRDLSIQILTTSRDTREHYISAFLHSQLFFPSPDRVQTSPTELLSIYDPTHHFDSKCMNLLTQYMSGNLAGASPEADMELALSNLAEVDFAFDCNDLERSFRQFLTKYELGQTITLDALNVNVASRQLDGRLAEIATPIDGPLAPDIRIRQALLKQFGGLPESPASWKQVEITDASQLYLSEIIRRLRPGAKLGPGSGVFEYRGNDLLLHPPKIGETRLTTGPLLHCTPDQVFSCELEVGPLAVTPVRFVVHVEWGNSSAMRYDALISAGERRPIEVPLLGAEGELSLTLATSSHNGGPNDYAWAFVRAPRISSRDST